MPLVISDDDLHAVKLTPDEARIEIACRLFDAGKLALWPAAQFAHLSRSEMEDELHSRKIPIYRYTLEDFHEDLTTINHLKNLRESGKS
ncbi:MAG TPA: UPF0175 family protein [Tepidisphaeraceae bacterium]|jgi:predicted HTH domain antitoxin|nr:UPF0175 family protein [Tepidisphaeraceae bacterium]